MAQLPLLSGKDLIKALAALGYREVRQRGSHIRLSCPGRKSVTIPNYKTIDRSLLRKILRDADLDVDALLKLL
jgi:predicted RNA binding protein YcfA (HicA-like mRNA interferase family)